ncbi:MAG TPA: M36 family metallopeptidase, partial [Candidatus Sulfopaludibacter sp.]|nr:M36 family metallopeptidase [Candidatus Sulfopaludibacter sp.]
FGAQTVGAGQFENSFFSLDGTDDDGVQPEVAMFVSGGTGALSDVFTDGAYDAEVMVHEYTHGVSNRLARQVYYTFQGMAMGEAWSDFYSLEYTIPFGAAPANGVYPAGEYFTQSWGTGIRTRPYSTDLAVDPLTYANLGHVIVFPEVHSDGEIWMEALWDARANLIAQWGETEGRKRIRQLVIDGMKLAVPQASMIDMRDAILLADRVDYKGASQSQLWAAFAKRGMGALAFSDGGDTVHALSSFDLPSTTGQLKFYDNPIVIGEPVRVTLQDSNYTQPSVLIQLTTSSGDLENLILHQQGSVYEGYIFTAQSSVTQGNSRLDLSSTDQISAYYVDMDTGSGAAKLIQTTIQTMMPYAFSTGAQAFSFSGEHRVNIPTGSYIIQQLPFSFPFFDKTYGSVFVFPNGLLAFELPATPGACTDSANLARYHAITPLWTAANATSMSGTAQASEGLYTSTSPISITFRWAGQFSGVDQSPSPTNYAATLYSDGRVQFNYGTGNQAVNTPGNFNGCGPTVLGLGNGHDVYSLAYVSGTFTNLSTVHFDPPFNNSSLPTATIATPKNGDHVQDILTVSGTAADAAASVVALDVFIDGVNQAHAVPAGPSLGWSATLNIAGLGIAAGSHTLAVRVTNARGAFANLPATPLTFTVDPGSAFPPVVAIESPADGAMIKGTLTVKGYAYIAGLRVTAVDTLIDGFVYGPTGYGVPRTDICGSLTPAPPNCPVVGFLANLDTVQATPPIPDGPHTLQVRVRDQTGRLTLYPGTPLHITVQNGPAAPVIGVLESPLPNATLSGTVTLSGYIYSTGQKIVAGLVIVDDVSLGLVKLGVPRPDVCPLLPNAGACPNIGFTFTLDTTKLPNGPHVLGIQGVNGRGDSAIFPSQVANGINIFVQN